MSIISPIQIQNKIIFIRDQQVMLDRDIAELYQTETRILKQAVNRNVERFPSGFMFVLNKSDMELLVSQSVIPSLKYFGGAKPYVFTEQGVAMLSTVLRNNTAIKVSIQIMQAFINLRKFLVQNASVFQRLDQLELKQLHTDGKLEEVFKALEAGQPQPEKGIFFDGQIFDAYAFVSNLIKDAKKDIILIDNYADESVLTLLSKRKPKVTATIYTKVISSTLKLDIEKHNAQYPAVIIKIFTESHDRFLIIDQKVLYHIGASLKDMGKKWFAFSRMDSLTEQVLDKLQASAV